MARVQRVFISYRREDAADVAGRIRDWLVQTWNLSRENVFMDVSTILPGADFEQVIDQAIAQCEAMIIIMSPSWLTHVYTSDTSYPRFEAEAALRRNLLIIPVLVGGATTPTAEQLPETLRPLLRRNIRPIRADSFDYDMEWVRKALGVRTISRAPFISAIVALLLVAAGLGILSQVPKGNPVWRVFHSSTTTPNASPSSSRPDTFTTSGPVPANNTSPEEPASGTFDTFAIPTPNSNPQYITQGPDGALWFTENSGNKIGRITTDGEITTEFPIPTPNAGAEGIVSGPDGNLWFTEGSATSNSIGRVDRSGSFSRFPIPSAKSFAREIVVGADGALWFTEEGTGKIGRITTSGNITEFAVRSGAFISGIAKGGDGNVWFTEGNSNRLGKITPSGAISEITITCPVDITPGPDRDGNLWFREGCGRNVIGRVTRDGSVTEFTFPGGSDPGGIVVGPDGNIWFLSQAKDAVMIGWSTLSGQITQKVLSNSSAFPRSPVVGPDGNLWLLLGASVARYVV